jgi:hypothetical protein
MAAGFRTTLAFAVLLAPVLASCQVTGQSDPGLGRFVYPNAKALIGIDWGRIRQSPAGAMIREKWLGTSAATAIPGIELLNDIDRVLISSPGKDSAGDSSESRILVAIQGHFDAGRVRHVFTRLGKPQSYNSFQVFRPQVRNREGDAQGNDAPQGNDAAQGNDARDTAWVLFDADTILYGDAPSVFAALERNPLAQAPPAPSPVGSIAARQAKMDASYDLWVIMDATEMDATEIASNDQIAALFRGGEWASEAQGFEAGVNFRSGLAADISVRFSSDATARRVIAELTRAMNIVAKDNSSGKQVRNIAQKLKFNVDGSSIRMGLRLSQQELEQSAEAFAVSHKTSTQLAGNAPGKTGAVANPTPAPNATPASVKPAMIRIEGLDEGTREIPLGDAQH